MKLMIMGVMRRSYLTVSWTEENFQKPLKIIEAKFWITNQSINPQDNFANKYMIARTNIETINEMFTSSN